MGVSTATLITFSAYITLILSSAVWALRLTKNMSDYIVGERSLGRLLRLYQPVLSRPIKPFITRAIKAYAYAYAYAVA